MKKLIIWLAKVFNANIITEKIVVKEIIKYRYLTKGEIVGDVFIDGNLTINGNLQINGGITFYKQLDYDFTKN